MTKTKIYPVVILFVSIILAQFIYGCKKETTVPAAVTCDVKGTYSGTWTNHLGNTGTFAYVLKADNFTTGSASLSAATTAAGSYWNSCDSLKLYTFNFINSSYYYFEGKFSADRSTVSGIYKNLTTPSETGTFTLSKQQVDVPPPVTTCDVKGTYAGLWTNHLGNTGTFAYVLKADNFTTGSASVNASTNAIGSYWNNCDSVKLNTFNYINNNYYYFEGKFSANKATITGIYKNLTTTTETGTFTLTKQ
jgi:hypothetical protein